MSDEHSRQIASAYELLKQCTVVTQADAKRIADQTGASLRVIIARAAANGNYVPNGQTAAKSARSTSKTQSSASATSEQPSHEISDYRIASHKTEADVTQEVNSMLKLGWRPLGGVAAAAFGMSPIGGNHYIQAMVK